TRWNPLQFITGPNAVLVSNGFGHSQLEFARDLGHILTLARISSLLKGHSVRTVIAFEPETARQLSKQLTGRGLNHASPQLSRRPCPTSLLVDLFPRGRPQGCGG